MPDKTSLKTLPKFIESKIKDIKRIVIKIGTRVIDNEKTDFNRVVITSIVGEIAELMSRGIEVILVSSGAVGAGLRALNVRQRPKSIHLRQAYAAVGQARLMQLYSDLFRSYGIITSQVLLTRSDLDRRDSYLNARETLQHLLVMGVLPIINENDTVAVEELNFGDNDFLAALVAGKMDAGMLILLTTVDGVYRSFNEKTKSGELIEVVQSNYDEIMPEISQNIDPLSMGGMRSKLEAGKNACSKGVLVTISNGLKIGIIGALLSGQAKATWMLPSIKRMAAWKYYLAFAKRPCGGKIVVDDGAVAALREHGKSLLASGVHGVKGYFKIKELVRIVDLNDREIARGLVNYSSDDLKHIQGHSTADIKQILQITNVSEVIHRNNLVLI
ncbi:MAG: glutamate 5-kinase [Candidatus Omnitrophota bacterium]|jgi:glutamate 5-kinase|nr:MAG: glutamate 5-kinase [Candidatus Omnitrophota bacterium]